MRLWYGSLYNYANVEHNDILEAQKNFISYNEEQSTKSNRYRSLFTTSNKTEFKLYLLKVLCMFWCEVYILIDVLKCAGCFEQNARAFI